MKLDDDILKLFEYPHTLSPEMKVTCALFQGLARELVQTHPANSDRTAALVALMLARDSAFRCRAPAVARDDKR